MNISEIEAPLIVAKTCGCREKSRRTVAYQFIDSYPSLCLDKKDLILGQLEACRSDLTTMQANLYQVERSIRKPENNTSDTLSYLCSYACTTVK
jgi:hypothetical protein